MERKIGEIFEYNGEWYQCVVAIQGCRECSFRTQDYCTRHSECFSDARSDGISVIFKKLEKVGEPFTIVGKLYQHYKVFDIDNVCGDGFWCIHNYKEKTLTIEIKQTKEDMEDKNNAKHSNSEQIGKNLKEFDLEAAKTGKPVCTRDGRKARIICFDAKGEKPIIALIANGNSEDVNYYYITGKVRFLDKEDENDLMMLSEKKEGWVNIYRNEKGEYWSEQILFSTKKDATDFVHDYAQYVTTVKIEWEE